MVKREAEKLLRSYAKQFRAIAIVGPRQSGKTTLAKMVFPKKPYVSLENPDERRLAQEDPRSFLARYKSGCIIDEVQRVPEIFNYLQQILDESSKDGQFVLTGSNNFLMQASITQSLAGRIGFIDLLPLTLNEISATQTSERVASNNKLKESSTPPRYINTDELILSGCYPEIYDKNRDPRIWYPAYIRTYIERDVKQIRNIESTLHFHRFLKLCAGRCGQQWSASALSNECGVDVRTINAWLSVLVSSYIVFLLPPHYKSFNKRIVKTPKLYFTDTGLACSLLGIKTASELSNSHFRGALFENFVLGEINKERTNKGNPFEFYYWRENNGLEVDVLIEKAGEMLPIEIKSAQTYTDTFIKSIRQYNKLSGQSKGILLYDGQQEWTSPEQLAIVNWRKIAGLLV